MARRPRTWSGLMPEPRARSSASVTGGHFSVWLRLDRSFFNIPPPVFRSRWLASEPASESGWAGRAAVFREPFMARLRRREGAVAAPAAPAETRQTAAGISRWRSFVCGNGKAGAWLAENAGHCHSYRPGANVLVTRVCRFCTAACFISCSTKL